MVRFTESGIATEAGHYDVDVIDFRHAAQHRHDQQAAEDEWIDHVNGGIVGTLQETAKSWAFGSNVPGRKRAYLRLDRPRAQLRQ